MVSQTKTWGKSVMEITGCSDGFMKFMSAWGQAEAGKGAMNCTLSSSITTLKSLDTTADLPLNSGSSVSFYLGALKSYKETAEKPATVNLCQVRNSTQGAVLRLSRKITHNSLLQPC